MKWEISLLFRVSSNRILQRSAPKPSPPRSSTSSKQFRNSVGGQFEESQGGRAGIGLTSSFLSLLCLLPVAAGVVLGVGLPHMMVVVVLNCLVAAVAAVGPALGGLGDIEVRVENGGFFIKY